MFKEYFDNRIESLRALPKKAMAGLASYEKRYGKTRTRAVLCGGLCLCLALLAGVGTAVETPEKGLFRPNEELCLAQDLISANIAEAEYLASLPAVSIYVDGSEVVALDSEEAAQNVIDRVLAHYQVSSKGSTIISAQYRENVEVATSLGLTRGDAMDEDSAVNYILTGSKESKTYTVQAGDTYWTIASRNGIRVSELEACNPNADPEHISIGQTLNLFEAKPYLHVKMEEEIHTTEAIAFNVVYEDTNVLNKGEVQVKSPGVEGSQEVVYRVISENGVEVSRQQISATVISEPVDQVALRGTKPIVMVAGTGSLSNPMSHMQLSSAFGSRGGGRHTGCDFRNPKGTAIYAADKGTVTYAGWDGTYGNIVRISHGSGMETWYAHCDTMLVKVGEQVAKGEQIATVGITGRATGYHLHFEVRKNGTPQNPLNYLNY